MRNLPLQETDLLLHEAGAPPIHTPLEVLMQLPQRVKDRLYVVHSSTIPPDCDLRVAPTGTAGTLRLDQIQRGGIVGTGTSASTWVERSSRKSRYSRDAYSISLEDGETMSSPWNMTSNEYAPISEDGSTTEGMTTTNGSFANNHLSGIGAVGASVPLVSLRPASSTDAWFILNLLSAVPFLSRYVATRLSHIFSHHVSHTRSRNIACPTPLQWKSSRLLVLIHIVRMM